VSWWNWQGRKSGNCNSETAGTATATRRNSKDKKAGTAKAKRRNSNGKKAEQQRQKRRNGNSKRAEQLLKSYLRRDAGAIWRLSSCCSAFFAVAVPPFCR
jgi:hypothetical protein